MGFWKLAQPDEALAAVDARSGKRWTYGGLRNDVARVEAALPRVGRKTLGLLIAENRYECLVVYLAALNAGSALILLDSSVNPGLLRNFIAGYRPDWICASERGADLGTGYRQTALDEAGLFASGDTVIYQKEEVEKLDIHPELALLLNTSGSTGSPKLVRLALRNLEANAQSIAEYLLLTPGQRPITSLPMPYSYGLSVINSHLYAGAAIIFTDHSVLRREFWDAVEQYNCTSFAGVPYTYQLLLEAGLLKKKGSSLYMLTQAGGKLEDRYVTQMQQLASARGWRFFVMYGQTEATARISYVPFERLGEKIGSVGIAIPRGSLRTDEQTGELIYSGPNVMLGYAESREDLAHGDQLNGILRTGDVARQDADGYFYITGRLKRFLKLFGKRFNLVEVESVLSQRLNAPVACFGRDDLMTAAVENCRHVDDATRVVCQLFDLPRTAVKVISVPELPRTSNGKIDYPRLSGAGPQYELIAAR